MASKSDVIMKSGVVTKVINHNRELNVKAGPIDSENTKFHI